MHIEGYNMIKISNIQRFSLDDGPGIRTNIFLIGCNMNCLWCHNPENLRENLIAFNPIICTMCTKCMKVCNQKAHYIENEKHVFDRKKCISCFKCVQVCENGALYRNSYNISDEEVIELVMHDYDFYEKSGGGITFSGGEPIIQDKNLLTLVKKIKKKKVNVAIETAFNYEFERIEPFFDFIDLYIIDFKAFSSNLHKKCTGVDNIQIKRNIDMLIQNKKRIWIRIPVITGLNISLAEMEKIGKFFRDKEIEKIELIPYHNMGIDKYKLYGMKYHLENVYPPTKKYMNFLNEILRHNNLPIEE